jgi:O-antigen/teichoic acid export membrane protein
LSPNGRDSSGSADPGGRAEGRGGGSAGRGGGSADPGGGSEGAGGRSAGRGGQARIPDHPGGTGAVLGVRLMRYSGVQGATGAATAVLQLATLFVIGHFIGADGLGRYALLYFLAALITQALVIGTKPGVIRRTFGAGDDEEGDADDEDASEEISATPQRSLGVGLIWSVFLAGAAVAVVYALREPIADLLLGDPGAAAAVAWAGALGGATAFMRVATIVLWFERRPAAYVVAEGSRGTLALAGVTAFLASGSGLEGAIAGATAGTLVSAGIAIFLLSGSFELAFDPRETLRIIARGGPRGPILTSFWVIQNADVFVLSRFVGDADLGIYMLVSRLGFVGSFLPMGFRMALRPLRKAAIYKAVEDQYGKATQRGQILGYFTILCISAVLIMVVLGRLLVEVAPPQFADAAPLIPLAAAGMVGPALLRTVNQQTSWPGKTKLVFILTTVGCAIAFIAITAALAPEIGIYAAPVAMIVSLFGPSLWYFIRCQRSERRIAYPYSEVARAAVLATILGAGYNLLPELPIAIDIVAALLVLAAYAALLFVLRVVPEYHWPALAHMARSVVAGRADRFNPRRGIRALAPEERAELRVAVTERIDPTLLSGPAADQEAAARLVSILRRAGRTGGMTVGDPGDDDALVASFLFADAPTAVRNATMRSLMAAGADSGDLRALEDLVAHLAKVPDDAWAGAPAGEGAGGRWRRRRTRRAGSRA